MYIYCCCHTFVLFSHLMLIHTCNIMHTVTDLQALNTCTGIQWNHASTFCVISCTGMIIISVWESCLKDGCMQQCRFTILVMLWFCSLNKCKYVSINLWKLQYACQFNAGSVDANAYLGEVQSSSFLKWGWGGGGEWGVTGGGGDWVVYTVLTGEEKKI